MIHSTVINLHPNEYTQELRYYPFAVNLERCVESCNILNDLSNKVCVPNKTEDLNLSMFNMITGTNELKTSTKHVLRECKCKFDVRKCNSNQNWNNDQCECKCNKDHIYEKYYIWNPATCSSKNGKYLASTIDDSVITCDEIIKRELSWTTKKQKLFQQILMKKKGTCKTQSFSIFLAFLLITTTLLIAVTIYSYLIKYRAIQKHLLSFYTTNNKPKEFYK